MFRIVWWHNQLSHTV